MSLWRSHHRSLFRRMPAGDTRVVEVDGWEANVVHE